MIRDTVSVLLSCKEFTKIQPTRGTLCVVSKTCPLRFTKPVRRPVLVVHILLIKG